MSAQAKFQLDWEAHLEALPVATWIVRYSEEPDVSQWEQLSGRERCGPVFANRACREILGLAEGHTDNMAMQRCLHPEDSLDCLDAWDDFLEGRIEQFHRTFRWIRPDTKETVTLKAERYRPGIGRAQRPLCGDIQGWLRPATAEAALSRKRSVTAPVSRSSPNDYPRHPGARRPSRARNPRFRVRRTTALLSEALPLRSTKNLESLEQMREQATGVISELRDELRDNDETISKLQALCAVSHRRYAVYRYHIGALRGERKQLRLEIERLTRAAQSMPNPNPTKEKGQ